MWPSRSLGLPAEGVLGLFGPAFAAGGLVLALLLAAELAAAGSGLSEIGLIFARPKGNLAIAGATLGLQAAFSLLLVPLYGAAGAAGALFLSVLVAGIARQILMGRVLGVAVGFWRWSLLAAGTAAFAIGYAARGLPELWQMLVTIPGVLLVFALVVWRFGYGPADRVLLLRARN